MSSNISFRFSDLEESPTSKRHKKHKKHKHKKSKHTDEDDIVDVGGVAIPAGEEVSKPAIRLKLKLGAHTVTKRYFDCHFMQISTIM